MQNSACAVRGPPQTQRSSQPPGSPLLGTQPNATGRRLATRPDAYQRANRTPDAEEDAVNSYSPSTYAPPPGTFMPASCSFRVSVSIICRASGSASCSWIAAWPPPSTRVPS